MRFRSVSWLVLVALTPLVFATDDATLMKRAETLAKETLIIDGHVDIPYRIFEAEEMIDISKRTDSDDFERVWKEVERIAADWK